MENNEMNTNEQESQHIGKNKILVVLTKDNESIKVVAPKAIKMGFFQTFLELRFGLPPLDVTPTDWLGLAHLGAAFIILLLCVFLNHNPLFIILGLFVLGYNFYITKNYFRYFIRRKLAEGYKVEDPEIYKLVEEAKAVPKTENEKKSFKLKTKIYFIALGVLAIVGFIGGGSNNIKTVKSSVLGYDETVSIGNALEKHNSFISYNWDSFTTDRKQDVVEFVGKVPLASYFDDDSYNGNLDFIVQFTFNNSGDDFSVTYIGCRYYKPGENDETTFSINIDSGLELIYEEYAISQENLLYLYYF